MVSTLEGIVTNSFLAGEDYKGNHASEPKGYFIGNPPPPYQNDGCAIALSDENCSRNDWGIFVKPDLDYSFLQSNPGQCHKKCSSADAARGSFDDEHVGDLENEIEQWQIPNGYRPQPGDRMTMTGRWVIDCGHEDWHPELHPYESFVSTHLEHRAGALGGMQSVATIIVTGTWQGEALDLEVWPPPRPSACAQLHVEKESGGLLLGVKPIAEHLLPADNPNHGVFHVEAQVAHKIGNGGWNDAYPVADRRVVMKAVAYWVNDPACQ
jgi:hypothetical protein